ncbi:MAG: hypothetical protein E6J26_09395 [Chloroflexi bacterium]|nr:MAG: hypothetical protein E6J26_09395 [Chloroflexota bacterium]
MPRSIWRTGSSVPDGGLDAEKWLREHNLCALATGRRDGSPQLSLVSYAYDGEDIVISTATDRPKWLNSRRQPRVAVLVQDGRQYVLVYGRAEYIESDPERLAVAELNAEKRVILRVIPEKIVPHS